MYKFNQKAFIREFYALSLFVGLMWGNGVLQWKMALGMLAVGTIIATMANSPKKIDHNDYQTTITGLSLVGFGVIAVVATATFGFAGMLLSTLASIFLVCVLGCFGYSYPKASLLAYAVQLPALFAVIAYSDWRFSSNPFLGA